MEQVRFIDPFATEERSSVVGARDRGLTAVPGGKSGATAAARPRRGREHEVRRLIKDLDALASKKTQAN